MSVASIFIVMLFLISWLAWAALAKVTLYEATSAARTEVDKAAHAVQAPLAGRIVSTRLAEAHERRAEVEVRQVCTAMAHHRHRSR